MAVAASEVLRHRARLDEAAVRVAAGKMSGAVRTGAGFGEHAFAIETGVIFGSGSSRTRLRPQN